MGCLDGWLSEISLVPPLRMKYHLILKISVLYIGLFLLRVIFTLLLLQIHVVSLRLEFAQTQLSFERDNLRHGRSPSLRFAS